MTPEERVGAVQSLIEKLAGRDPITSIQDWVAVLEALKEEMIERHSNLHYVYVYPDLNPPRIGSRRIES